MWLADHQLDSDPNQTMITVFSGRGLLIESTTGPTWLYGTAVEHNVLYQYQFANTANIYAGFIQTETPYFQSDPPAPAPFVTNSAFQDPNFATICAGSANATLCQKAFGLRVVGSDQALVYGAGLYSFFEKGSTCKCFCFSVFFLDSILHLKWRLSFFPIYIFTDFGFIACLNNNCQTTVLSIEAQGSKSVLIYNLNTIGVPNMITVYGTSVAQGTDNVATFPDTIAYYKNL